MLMPESAWAGGFKDFLFRARRPKSLVAFNDALPAKYKLIYKVGGKWLAMPGVNVDPINSLVLKRAVLDGDGNVIAPAIHSTAIHYNIRLTPQWTGYAGITIPDSDPDSADDRLNRSKFKRWFKRNGIERLDNASEHPRTGRANMRWFGWEDETERLDITIDEPHFQLRVWL